MSVKKPEFKLTHNITNGYLVLTINRVELDPTLQALFLACQLEQTSTYRNGTTDWEVSLRATMDYKGCEARCADVLYTKLRKYFAYDPDLDNLDLETKIDIVYLDGEEYISLSWRKEDLKNILSVTNFKNGHTLRSYLLKSGFRAEKGTLVTPTSVGMFRFVKEKNFHKAIPVRQAFYDSAKFYSELAQHRRDVRNKFAKALDTFLANWKGRPLMQHQVDYLRYVAELGDAQCNFDMGLGKTFTSLVQATIIKSIVDCKIYVITKASVIPQWRDENWQHTRLPIEVVSWAKIPDRTSSQNYIVIADESHFTQSEKTTRTKRYVRFCEHALMTINLTGTPFKNGQPENAVASLKAMGVWQYGNLDMESFKTNYGKYFYYRHKDECLDLPEKTRVERLVEFTPQQVEEVNKAFADFMVAYEERAKEGKVSMAAAHLVALQVLRKLLAKGKSSYAVELVQEVVEGGQQCVVFCDFLEPLQSIKAELGDDCVWLQASDTPEQRYAKQQKFQNGEVKVFISSYKCGGVGINLVPCTNVVCIDRPWTPADVIQAEDRCHRIGQVNSLTVYWLYYYDRSNIEKKVEDILSTKQDSTNYLLDNEYETLGSGSEEGTWVNLLDKAAQML